MLDQASRGERRQRLLDQRGPGHISTELNTPSGVGSRSGPTTSASSTSPRPQHSGQAPRIDTRLRGASEAAQRQPQNSPSATQTSITPASSSRWTVFISGASRHQGDGVALHGHRCGVELGVGRAAHHGQEPLCALGFGAGSRGNSGSRSQGLAPGVGDVRHSNSTPRSFGARKFEEGGGTGERTSPVHFMAQFGRESRPRLAGAAQKDRYILGTQDRTWTQAGALHSAGVFGLSSFL